MSGTRDSGAIPPLDAPVVDDAEPTDGRARRATRSRQLVVEAFLDLLLEGEPRPTAQQVSDRCGVSMRTIFRLFDDVDAMHAAAISTQIARVSHLIVRVEPTGSLDERIRAVVGSRAALFDEIAPVRRMAMRLAPTSWPIQADLDRSDAWFRDQLVTVFDAELSTLPADERAATLDALDAVTCFEIWDRLRNRQGRTTAEATSITCRLVAGLVGGPVDDAPR